MLIEAPLAAAARDVANRLFDALPVTARSCHMLSLAFKDGARLASGNRTHQQVLYALADLCSAVANLRDEEALLEADTEPG